MRHARSRRICLASRSPEYLARKKLASWLAAFVMSVAPVAATAQSVPPGAPISQTRPETSGLSTLDGLSAAALSKLSEPQVMAEALSAGTGLPLRVIVEFEAPRLPDGVQGGSVAADDLTVAHVSGAQERILGRVLGPLGLGAPQAESTLALTRMTYSPLFALDVDAALLARLAGDPEVVRIHVDHTGEPALTVSLPLIGMPDAIAARGTFRGTGAGQVVAVLDTGVRHVHEFLTGRVVESACYSTASSDPVRHSLCPGGVNSVVNTSNGTAGIDCSRIDSTGCGHGTHVAGIAAGRFATPGAGNPANGVATDGRIFAINIFHRLPRVRCGVGHNPSLDFCLSYLQSDLIQALERVYARRDSRSIAAVNLSIQGGRYDSPCIDNPARRIVQNLRGAGIAVIAAAGNNAYTTAVSYPACIPEVIAVANSMNTDELNNSSNWGSQIDIAAPGTGILSSDSRDANGSSNTAYSLNTGTSMAAPHVAGAFAVIRSVVPTATVDQILTALRDSGSEVTFRAHTVPRINVDAALEQIIDGHTVATTITLTGPATSTRASTVSFSVRVADPSAPSVFPTGTVSFRRGGVEFGRAVLNDGFARVSTSAFPAGSHRIVAVYLGDAARTGVTPQIQYRMATSAELGHSVTIPSRWSTTTTLTGTTSGILGFNQTYTATVQASGGGAPTGEVSFRRNGIPFATATLNAQGRASVSHALPQGTQNITAYYPGTPGHNASTSNMLIVTVSPPTYRTTTRLTAPATGTARAPLVFTAFVEATAIPPSGRVSFRRNGVEFATGTVGVIGAYRGVSVTAALPAGAHDVTAHFLGQASFGASASAARRVNVSQLATTATLTGPAEAEEGEMLTYRMRVTAPGATPAGSVSFRRNGEEFAADTLDGAGEASANASFPQGEQRITAHYAGEGDFAPAASSSVVLAVRAAPPASGAFLGGGAVFGFTEACAPAWGGRGEPVTVRYSPSELNEMPSQVTVAWQEGSEHVALWGAMTPSTAFFGAAGRAMWSRFVFYPLRPLMRVVQREVTLPQGEELARAQELHLRLRVQNFSAMPGCAATVAATLHRQ